MIDALALPELIEQDVVFYNVAMSLNQQPQNGSFAKRQFAQRRRSILVTKHQLLFLKIQYELSKV